MTINSEITSKKINGATVVFNNSSRKWVYKKNFRVPLNWSNPKKRLRSQHLRLKRNQFPRWWSHLKSFQLQSTKMASKFKNPGGKRRIEKLRRFRIKYTSKLPTQVKEGVADVAEELRWLSTRKSSRLRNSSPRMRRNMTQITRGW